MGAHEQDDPRKIQEVDDLWSLVLCTDCFLLRGRPEKGMTVADIMGVTVYDDYGIILMLRGNKIRFMPGDDSLSPDVIAALIKLDWHPTRRWVSPLRLLAIVGA